MYQEMLSDTMARYAQVYGDYPERMWASLSFGDEVENEFRNQGNIIHDPGCAPYLGVNEFIYRGCRVACTMDTDVPTVVAIRN